MDEDSGNHSANLVSDNDDTNGFDSMDKDSNNGSS